MPHETGSFDLHRCLPLPADRLWQVLTDPHQRSLWNGPTSDTTVTVERADLRVGGHERHHYSTVSMADEMPPFTAETRWYHLDAPARAVFTETVWIDGAAMFTSLVTYALTPSRGAEQGVAGTTTDLHITIASSSFTDSEIGSDLALGWEAALANLETHIASLTEPAA